MTARDSLATGIDRVEFMIAAQPRRATPRRIGAHRERRRAVTRALLATKRVLAGVGTASTGGGPVGTYVFDEVDTGVGGAVSESIGRKLLEVAQHHQVLCITHAPQIAALAHTHLRAEKLVREGRTHSQLVPLASDRRVEEVARMLGGRTVTDAARHAARALMHPEPEAIGELSP